MARNLPQQFRIHHGSLPRIVQLLETIKLTIENDTKANWLTFHLFVCLQIQMATVRRHWQILYKTVQWFTSDCLCRYAGGSGSRTSFYPSCRFRSPKWRFGNETFVARWRLRRSSIIRPTHTWILNGSRTIHTKTGQLSGGSVEEIEPADALLPLLMSWHIKFRDEFLVVPNRWNCEL